MPRPRPTLVLVLLGLAFAPPTTTQVTASSPEPIRLVTGDRYPPLTGRDLPAGGLATEIVLAAFDRIGLEVEVEFAPWKRGYEEAKRGRYNGTFPYVRTVDREQHFLYSAPILQLESRVFVRSESPLTRISELGSPGLTECLPLGFAKGGDPDSEADAPAVTTVTPPEMTSCFRMILLGRADYFRIGEILGWATVRQLGIPEDTLRTLDGESEVVSQHLIVPRAWPDGRTLLERFDTAVAELRAEGEIERLVARHRGDRLEVAGPAAHPPDD